jgi:hypothetical protein
MPHVLTRTHVTAPKGLIEEVDRLVGPRRRSEFFAEAAAEKLKREKLLQTTRHAMTLPPELGVPGWETPEAVSQWVRDIRKESDPKRPMKYLLDADTLIDVLQNNGQTRERVTALIETGDEVALCAISVAELYSGLSEVRRKRWD